MEHDREGLVPLQKLRQNLQASTYTPFEARGLLSGTIIRGTPMPGQTLSCSNLGQIALPTDRIACAFNAGIA
jgi:hypothetical protein